MGAPSGCVPSPASGRLESNLRCFGNFDAGNPTAVPSFETQPIKGTVTAVRTLWLAAASAPKPLQSMPPPFSKNQSLPVFHSFLSQFKRVVGFPPKRSAP